MQCNYEDIFVVLSHVASYDLYADTITVVMYILYFSLVHLLGPLMEALTSVLMDQTWE